MSIATRNRILVWTLAVGYILLGVWITRHRFKGEPPDGRWEWQIGTNKRITEVIKLEDQ
jgi:hypothetical protein